MNVWALLANILGLIILLAYFTVIGVIVRLFVRASIEAIGEFRQATTFRTRFDYGFQTFVGFGCATGISVCVLCGLIATLF